MKTHTPPHSITIHILHDDTLTDDNREKFLTLTERYNQLVEFYNVAKLCADKLETIRNFFPAADKTRFTLGMIYRFFIPDVLPADIEKAIYLDADIIVNLDINELWQIELDDKILGVITAPSIGTPINKQDKIHLDGYVEAADYFNSGVLLMNLKLFRNENDIFMSGIEFVAANPVYARFLDQAILNYLFSTRSLSLNGKYNRFVRIARRINEPVMKKIYHYTVNSLQLDTNDPFNRLWMEYFAKTPWFNADIIGRLNEAIQQFNVRLRKAMTNLSVITSGKIRCFFIEPAKVDEMKKFFSIRDDEEIILAENEDSVQKLIDTMKNYRNERFFIIMPRKILGKKIPLKKLKKLGLVDGREYWKGWGFFSEEQGFPMDTYFIIQAL